MVSVSVLWYSFVGSSARRIAERFVGNRGLLVVIHEYFLPVAIPGSSFVGHGLF